MASGYALFGISKVCSALSKTVTYCFVMDPSFLMYAMLILWILKVWYYSLTKVCLILIWLEPFFHSQDSKFPPAFYSHIYFHCFIGEKYFSMHFSKSFSYVFLNLYLLKYSPIALEKFSSPIKYINCFIVAAPFE